MGPGWEWGELSRLLNVKFLVRTVLRIHRSSREKKSDTRAVPETQEAGVSPKCPKCLPAAEFQLHRPFGRHPGNRIPGLGVGGEG